MTGSELKPSVEKTEPLTVDTNALLKCGEQLLLESLEVGRQFCRAMVGFSLTAIPVYVGLLKLFFPSAGMQMTGPRYAWVIPVALFLAAASVAVWGYLPKFGNVSLELVDELRSTRNAAVRHRHQAGVGSFILFVLGVIASVIVLLH